MGIPLLEGLALGRAAVHLVRRKVDEVLQVGQAARELKQVEGGLDIVLHKGHRCVDRVVHVRLGRDVQDHLDLRRVHLVEQSGREFIGEVEAEDLDQMEDAGGAKPIEALGSVRELVEHHQLVVGVPREVLDHVVADEAAASRDQTLLIPTLERDARGSESALGGDGGREGLDRVDDSLAVRGAKPPADGHTRHLARESIELRQQGDEACHGRVGVVALMHGGGDDAAVAQVLVEAVALPVEDAQRVQPVRRARPLGQRCEQLHPGQLLQVRVEVRRVLAAARKQAVDVGKVGKADGGVDVVHVELEAVLGDVRLHSEVRASSGAPLTVNSKPSDQLAALVEPLGGQEHHAAVDGGDVLDRLQRVDDRVPVRAQLAPAVLRAEGVRRVLDDVRPEAKAPEANLLDARDGVEVDGRSAPVHDDDDLGRGRQLPLQVQQAHVARLRVGVHPLDAHPVGEDWPVGGSAGERAGEHLVDLHR